MDARASTVAIVVANVKAVSASVPPTALASVETTVPAKPTVAVEPRRPDMHNSHHHSFHFITSYSSI